MKDLKTKLEGHYQPLFSVLPVKEHPACLEDCVEFYSENSSAGDDPACCDEHWRQCAEAARAVYGCVSDALRMLPVLIRRLTDITRWLIDNEHNPAYADAAIPVIRAAFLEV